MDAWNSLPNWIVMANSTNTFKRRLDICRTAYIYIYRITVVQPRRNKRLDYKVFAASIVNEEELGKALTDLVNLHESYCFN